VVKMLNGIRGREKKRIIEGKRVSESGKERGK
jgi:hypothetical protein